MSWFINRCGKRKSFPGKYGIQIQNDVNFMSAVTFFVLVKILVAVFLFPFFFFSLTKLTKKCPMHQKLWSYLILLEITNVMCLAGWCEFLWYAFEKGTLSLMSQWSKAASYLKQGIHAGFAAIEIHLPPFPCMNLPADCCAGSTSVARARWDLPGFTVSSRAWRHGTAKRFSVIHTAGEFLLNLTLRRINATSLYACSSVNLLPELLLRLAWDHISRGQTKTKQINFIRSAKCCLHCSTGEVFGKVCRVLRCLAQLRASKPGSQNVNTGVI